MASMYSIAGAQSVLPYMLSFTHRSIVPCTQSHHLLVMILCSACGCSFSVVGYMQHIYSTSHIACIKAYEQDLELANNKERSFQLANELNTFAGSYGDGYEDG